MISPPIKAGEARHFLQSAAELRPRRSLLAPHPEDMEVFAQLIVLLSAAAAATLNCSITKSHGGSFRYQIAEKPNSLKCTTSWEDRNGTVIVDIRRNSDIGLVVNHTLHSVDLKGCKDFLLYKRECDGVQVEVSCSVNCSLFVVKSHPPSRVCLSSNVCTDTTTFGVSAAAVFTVLLLPLLLVWLVRKRRTGGCRCGQGIYAPPSKQEEVQIEMEAKETIKTPQ
ncbi:hypothetical protein FQA47_007671 [Oryzias melastigma]|uniref:Uncharacterized protein n=1 Tax=Oryzias melastigma TaxID=30732 RepID=A0A834BY34_ORYME|nr:hypothetical protein FQA47_007671 [Oryzias melastigma]